LTATQADNVAVGSGALGHSLLTAAVLDALAARRAERYTLADAIAFAAAAVPRLYRAHLRGGSGSGGDGGAVQVPVMFDYRPAGDDVDLEPAAAPRVEPGCR
jgi:hypothetical protein